MSRGAKVLVGGSLLVTAVGMGALAWGLSRMQVEDASQWAAIVQAFAALLGIPGLVLTWLAVRQHGTDAGGSQLMRFGRVKAGGNVDQRGRQHGAGGSGGSQSMRFGRTKAGGNVDQRGRQQIGRDDGSDAGSSSGASGTP